MYYFRALAYFAFLWCIQCATLPDELDPFEQNEIIRNKAGDSLLNKWELIRGQTDNISPNALGQKSVSTFELLAKNGVFVDNSNFDLLLPVMMESTAAENYYSWQNRDKATPKFLKQNLAIKTLKSKEFDAFLTKTRNSVKKLAGFPDYFRLTKGFPELNLSWNKSFFEIFNNDISLLIDRNSDQPDALQIYGNSTQSILAQDFYQRLLVWADLDDSSFAPIKVNSYSMNNDRSLIFKFKLNPKLSNLTWDFVSQESKLPNGQTLTVIALTKEHQLLYDKLHLLHGYRNFIPIYQTGVACDWQNSTPIVGITRLTGIFRIKSNCSKIGSRMEWIFRLKVENEILKTVVEIERIGPDNKRLSWEPGREALAWQRQSTCDHDFQCRTLITLKDCIAYQLHPFSLKPPSIDFFSGSLRKGLYPYVLNANSVTREIVDFESSINSEKVLDICQPWLNKRPLTFGKCLPIKDLPIKRCVGQSLDEKIDYCKLLAFLIPQIYEAPKLYQSCADLSTIPEKQKTFLKSIIDKYELLEEDDILNFTENTLIIALSPKNWELGLEELRFLIDFSTLPYYVRQKQTHERKNSLPFNEDIEDFELEFQTNQNLRLIARLFRSAHSQDTRKHSYYESKFREIADTRDWIMLDIFKYLINQDRARSRLDCIVKGGKPCFDRAIHLYPAMDENE